MDSSSSNGSFEVRGTCNLLENEEFLIVPLGIDLREEARDVLIQGFADEPCTCKVQSDRSIRLQEVGNFVSFFADECSSNGLSVVCVEKQSGCVAGVFYVRDFKLPLPSDFSLEKSPSLIPAINCLHKIDDLYEQFRPDLQIGDCVDLWLLGVHPAFQRRGVARMLTEGAVANVLTKGFKYVVLEASGDFSAKCAKATGMTEVAHVIYADHEPCLAGDAHSRMGFWELTV